MEPEEKQPIDICKIVDESIEAWEKWFDDGVFKSKAEMQLAQTIYMTINHYKRRKNIHEDALKEWEMNND